MTSPMLVGAKLRRDFEAAEVRRKIAPVDDVALARQQLSALRPLWDDAVADVPYYGALVASGRAPRVIQSWGDVQSIPELTRQILQEQPAGFIRRSAKADGSMRTGGSTATPLEIGMNQAERDLMRVVKLAAWQSLGYGSSSRLFLVWGHAHLLGTGWRGRVNHARRRLADAVLGYKRVDAYRLSAAMCRDYAEQLIRFRPAGVIGYASALDLFARHTQCYRDRFHALKLAFVLSTAEAPPRPESQQLIEDLFGCVLVQEYGGAEFGQVAFKRGNQPFAVYSDLTYVECTADPASAAIVTTLYPRYVPLIRYRVGDGLEGAHRLDHGHVSRFDRVAGRVNEMIALDDGQSIHSVAVLHCVHQEQAVHNVQVVFTDAAVEMRLVADPGDHAAMETRVRGRLAQVHPSLAAAKFSYVEDVETNRAGKRSWLIDRRTRG